MTLTQITEKGIKDGEIVNADISSNTNDRIAGSKISPDFGSQIVGSGQVNITSTLPKVRLIDSNNSPSYSIRNNNGTFEVYDDNAPGARFSINDSKLVSKLNHDFDLGIDVTGAITGSGDLNIDDDTLYVDSTNNRVGLSTLTPNNTLDVHGGIVCSPNTDGKDTFELSTHAADEGRLKIKNVDTTTIQLRAGGVSYINGGNVGIGTTAPASALHIMDGDIFLTDNSTATDSGQAIYFQSTTNGWATNQAHCAIQGLRGNSSSGYIRFDTRLSGSTTEKMRITSTGNVGIGTTSPDQLLHISKSSGTTLFKASVAGNSTIGLELQKTGSTTQSWRIADGQTVNGKLEFHDLTDSATRMCIDGDGKVGIGTTSPSESLHVAGNIVNTQNVGGTNDSGIMLGNGHRLGFDQSGTRSWTIKATSGVLQVSSGDGASAPRVAGLLFGSDTASANTLDDYEEGTFTPTMITDGANASMTIQVDHASYTKIGRLVTCFYQIKRNDSNSGNGNLVMQGLPYTVSYSTQSGTWWADHGGPTAGNGDIVGGLHNVYSTSCYFTQPTRKNNSDTQSTAANRYLQHQQWTNTRWIYGSFSYHTST